METVAPIITLTGSLWQIIAETSTFGAIILAALLFMSIVSWVIIFHKWRHYKAVMDSNSAFMQQFKRSNRLSDVVGQAKGQRESHLARVFQGGYEELLQIKEQKNPGGAIQQSQQGLSESDIDVIEMSMERTLTEQMGFLEQRTIFLATTGNSAPFMGLLGTVVGIMDSFWAIGERGSASLAVVAPGIAEALLATIVGLGAAIPAVMAFNWANNKLKILNDQGNGFILAFLARLKKEEL
jgi:biopolymer transport protein TolQ